jgi:hypothetical protein
VSEAAKTLCFHCFIRIIPRHSVIYHQSIYIRTLLIGNQLLSLVIQELVEPALPSFVSTYGSSPNICNQEPANNPLGRHDGTGIDTRQMRWDLDPNGFFLIIASTAIISDSSTFAWYG